MRCDAASSVAISFVRMAPGLWIQIIHRQAVPKGSQVPNSGELGHQRLVRDHTVLAQAAANRVIYSCPAVGLNLKRRPSGAKARLISGRFTARLKSCPFKTGQHTAFFRSL